MQLSYGSTSEGIVIEIGYRVNPVNPIDKIKIDT